MTAHRRTRVRPAMAMAAGLLFGVLSLGPSPAQADGVPWTVSMVGAHRSCSVMLGFDEAGAAGAMTMPAGCRRALPALVAVKSWAIASDGIITFNDAGGQAVLTFTRQDDGTWRTGEMAGHQMSLAPAAPAPDLAGVAQSNLGAVALMPAPAADGTVVELATSTPAAKASAPSAKDAAGRYAVMRGDRDTGCMVTLDADTRGPKGAFKARLAPACRDQGIVIFDPLGWQLKNGGLILTARKGHSITLAKDANGVWVKTPADVKALGLKPI